MTSVPAFDRAGVVRSESRPVSTLGRIGPLIAAVALSGCMPASWGAAALLHPGHRPVDKVPTRSFEAVEFDGAGVRLKGWLFRSSGPRRGTVVYLHGVGDNRASGLGLAEHFLARGFDVLTYDSRAHGESGGAACTYGYYEKQDLARALDALPVGPVVLFGVSLGAAVALQAAADDGRITGVVAVASFSDLTTVGHERAPWFASSSNVANAFAVAENEAHFQVDSVSPQAAATHIAIPVLLIHGRADRETPPAHSERIFTALRGPKRLILVPDRGHNDSLSPSFVWTAIDEWIDILIKPAS